VIFVVDVLKGELETPVSTVGTVVKVIAPGPQAGNVAPLLVLTQLVKVVELVPVVSVVFKFVVNVMPVAGGAVGAVKPVPAK